MNVRDIVNIDPEVQFGAPVFTGTRINVETLLGHFQEGANLDEVLEDFPGIIKERAIATMEICNRFLAAKNLPELYAAIIDAQ